MEGKNRGKRSTVYMRAALDHGSLLFVPLENIPNVSRVADAIASDGGERKLTGERARKEGRKNRRKDIKGRRTSIEGGAALRIFDSSRRESGNRLETTFGARYCAA